MITKDKLFTHDVVYAILNRKQEVNKTCVILSQLMDMYDMKNYTSVADRLIMESENFAYAIEKDHITIDIFKNDMWLDEAALHIYRDILEGFIDNTKYNAFLDYIESCEDLRHMNNKSIALYRKMSIVGLIKSMITHGKYKKTMPYEVKMIRHWCLLELVSRTYLPKLYYSLRYLPTKIKLKSVTRYIEKKLVVDVPIDRD